MVPEILDALSPLVEQLGVIANLRPFKGGAAIAINTF